MRWRKEPSEKGLAAVTQGPRGAILRHKGEDVARVYALRKGFSHEYEGWYWVARSDEHHIPYKNTFTQPVDDLETAKAECKAYVKACLDAQKES